MSRFACSGPTARRTVFGRPQGFEGPLDAKGNIKLKIHWRTEQKPRRRNRPVQRFRNRRFRQNHLDATSDAGRRRVRISRAVISRVKTHGHDRAPSGDSKIVRTYFTRNRPPVFRGRRIKRKNRAWESTVKTDEKSSFSFLLFNYAADEPALQPWHRPRVTYTADATTSAVWTCLSRDNLRVQQCVLCR